MLHCACVVASVVSCLGAVSPATQPAKPYTGRVADLAVDAKNIGPAWLRRPSIIVEDPKSPPKVNKDQERVLEDMLELMGNEPIRSAADFSYGTAGEKDFDTLTLRVYVFESKDAARKWWKASFQYHRWEDRYRQVDGYGDEAVDSLRRNTRIVRQGNVVLSCSQTLGWDASHRVLGLLCEKLRSICGGPAPASQPAEPYQPEE